MGGLSPKWVVELKAFLEKVLIMQVSPREQLAPAQKSWVHSSNELNFEIRLAY
jgi:hypothetical protein